MNISVEIEIGRPKSMVWSAITDIKNSSKMISGIINVKIIEQPADGMVGLKWNETRKILGKEATEKMQITDCKDEEYYRTRAENCGALYLTKMSVAEHNQKTMLTMSLSGTSDSILVKILSSMMSLFMKKFMGKMRENDLRDIKAFVEIKSRCSWD